MPRRNSLISKLVHGRAWDEWDEEGGGDDADAPTPSAVETKPRSRRRRVAVALTFATLFVAGAAFSAAAGDQVRSALDDSATATAAAATDGTTRYGAAPPARDPAPAAATAPAPAASP